jgi:hypothetical protein
MEISKTLKIMEKKLMKNGPLLLKKNFLKAKKLFLGGT